MNDRLAKAGLCAGILALILTSAAHAGPRGVAAKPKACVTRLEPITPENPNPPVNGLDCYASFPEAIYAATEGTVLLPENASMKDQLQILRREMDTRRKATTPTGGPYVIAIDYRGTWYTSPALIYQGPYPCSPSVAYQQSYLPGAWNDDTSSSEGFSECYTNIHYEHSNWGGRMLVCTPNCGSFGSLDREISSRRWFF